MRKYLIAWILCLASLEASAQLVINKYAAVRGQTPCGNAFTVDDAGGFGVGDTILMIQMKGAYIDSSNSASFGAILSYRNAGNYEFNVVSGVSGNTISLKYKLARSYDIPNGRVQFVRVPFFKDFTVTQTLTAAPWNGEKGGIVVLNASGTVTMNAPIDVSNKGFRSGALVNVPVSSGICGQTDYYYASSPTSYGAEKGEGIAELSNARNTGRGAQASGGGGGNTSNAGGGGGANAGAGGGGGKESAIPQCQPSQAIGGDGGKALTYSNALNRVFMGGGAGAGHANNGDGGIGHPGGGIVILMANRLAGNAQPIRSNGGDGVGCVGDCWDGQPGGSAGGSVLLQVGSYSGNVTVQAAGGKGGSQGANNSSVGHNGPGGGGGGGVLWVSGGSVPTQVTASLPGGANGVFTNTNDPWGATSGQPGTSLTGLSIPFPKDTFAGAGQSISFKDSVVDCLIRALVIERPEDAPGMTYSWTFGDGTSSNLRNPVHSFPAYGTYIVTVTVDDGLGCTGTVSRTISISKDPGKTVDTAICAGASIRLNASGGSLHSWMPVTGISQPGASSVVASPMTTTTYIVTITAGACIYRDTFRIKVSPMPTANFSHYPTTPASNTPIEFTNRSLFADSWIWDFGDGSRSSELNPKHLYRRTGSYQACLTAISGHCRDTVCATVAADVRTSIGVPTGFTPNGDGRNDVLFVRGSAVSSVHLVIYNRWGQKVFETNSLDQGWDGTFNGKLQEIDIYAYVLQASFIDGTKTLKQGNINLLR